MADAAGLAGMNKLEELKICCAAIEKDTAKVIQKKNKSAAVRARRNLQELKRLAQELRVLVQECKAARVNEPLATHVNYHDQARDLDSKPEIESALLPNFETGATHMAIPRMEPGLPPTPSHLQPISALHDSHSGMLGQGPPVQPQGTFYYPFPNQFGQSLPFPHYGGRREY
mmetsp:Transcript_6187/g.12136  ORF Transcript_6187/g.12136 Transcript_6187/m.12136 type:complete len:172 (+) Transcript_6187:213-728(+)